MTSTHSATEFSSRNGADGPHQMSDDAEPHKPELSDHNDYFSEDEDREAFGHNRTLCGMYKDDLKRIKMNDPSVKRFCLNSGVAKHCSKRSFERLGFYLGRNQQIENMNLSYCGLTNSEMPLIFQSTAQCTGLTELDLSWNSFGVDGVRSMIPFFENSCNLHTIAVSGSAVKSEGFELMLKMVEGRKYKQLWFYDCEIENISSLEKYSLPYLEVLDLGGNGIGARGCEVISKLLQRGESKLKELCLCSNEIDHEGAEILIKALFKNTTLKELWLKENKVASEKRWAFLNTITNVESIKEEYYSMESQHQVGSQRQNLELVAKMKYMESSGRTTQHDPGKHS